MLFIIYGYVTTLILDGRVGSYVHVCQYVHVFYIN